MGKVGAEQRPDKMPKETGISSRAYEREEDTAFIPRKFVSICIVPSHKQLTRSSKETLELALSLVKWTARYSAKESDQHDSKQKTLSST